MIRRPPRSTRVRSSAASDVYKRQERRVNTKEKFVQVVKNSKQSDSAIFTGLHFQSAPASHQTVLEAEFFPTWKRQTTYQNPTGRCSMLRTTRGVFGSWKRLLPDAVS